MLFDYSKLNGKIRELYKTQEKFAKALGIGCSSLNKRLNNKQDFTSKEIFLACGLLGIEREEMHVYFFTVCVQEHEQVLPC